MRTTAYDRGSQHLIEGRLILIHCNGDSIRATCRGSGELHDVGHDPERGWYCTCQARSHSTRTTCSHLHALQRVCIRNREGDRR
jgi:hypothetical protein